MRLFCFKFIKKIERREKILNQFKKKIENIKDELEFASVLLKIEKNDHINSINDVVENIYNNNNEQNMFYDKNESLIYNKNFLQHFN